MTCSTQAPSSGAKIMSSLFKSEKSCIKTEEFCIKMMNFAVQSAIATAIDIPQNKIVVVTVCINIDEFVFKMMDFVFKVMDFVFKMMDLNVNVQETVRVGGAFGGKSSNNIPLCVAVAVGAHKHRRECRMQMSLEE